MYSYGRACIGRNSCSYIDLSKVIPSFEQGIRAPKHSTTLLTSLSILSTNPNSFIITLMRRLPDNKPFYEAQDLFKQTI